MSHRSLLLALSKAKNVQQFAQTLGTSPQAVTYWLDKKKPMPAEYVLKAEAAYGISRHDLRADIYPREDAA